MEKVTVELTAKGARTLRRRTGAATTQAAVKAALGPMVGEYSREFRRAMSESNRDEKAGRVRRFKSAKAAVDALYKL